MSNSASLDAVPARSSTGQVAVQLALQQTPRSLLRAAPGILLDAAQLNLTLSGHWNGEVATFQSRRVTERKVRSW